VNCTVQFVDVGLEWLEFNFLDHDCLIKELAMNIYGSRVEDITLLLSLTV
jgi:hypothetical protein